MALINCSECGKEVSEGAPHCDNCGCPIEQCCNNELAKQEAVTEEPLHDVMLQKKHKNEKRAMWIMVAVAILSIGICVIAIPVIFFAKKETMLEYKSLAVSVPTSFEGYDVSYELEENNIVYIALSDDEETICAILFRDFGIDNGTGSVVANEAMLSAVAVASLSYYETLYENRVRIAGNIMVKTAYKGISEQQVMYHNDAFIYHDVDTSYLINARYPTEHKTIATSFCDAILDSIVVT